MKKTLTIVMMIVLTLSLLLTGCQTDTTSETQNEPVATKSATPTPEPIDESLTFIDSLDRTNEFETIPETIISLSPTLTEIIYAVGMGDKLIGRTDWCNYPEQVLDISSVGNMDVPNIETIISLQPDVVAVSLITTQETVNKLEEASITCVVIDSETTFDGAYTNIDLVGTLLGAKEKANEIIETMKSETASIIDKVKDATPKTVYYVMGYGEYGDFTAGAGTFISDMINKAGGINVADDTTDWSYSVEKLVEHNPKVIICSMWAPAEGLKEATGYMDLTAIKEDFVYTIQDDLMQRIGPRITIGLLEVAKALHPSLFE